ESLDRVHHDEIELSDVNWKDNTFAAKHGEGEGDSGGAKGGHSSKGGGGSAGGRSQTARPLPTGGRGQAERTTLAAVGMTKMCDKACRNVLRYCCLGRVIETGQITFRKLSGETLLEYLVIELKDIKIIHFGWRWQVDTLVETVKLRVGIFLVKYT